MQSSEWNATINDVKNLLKIIINNLKSENIVKIFKQIIKDTAYSRLIKLLQGYKGSMLKVGGKNGKSATVSIVFIYLFNLFRLQ